MNIKTCTKCNKELPATIEYFHKEMRGKYGLRSKCKTCSYIDNRKILMNPGNIEKARISNRKHYSKNKNKYFLRWQKYYETNSEYLKERARKWGHLNLDKRKITDKKRRENPMFRLSSNISRSIRQSLFANNKNNAPWESLVDFTKHELKTHLEKQFKPGMSWENYGEWHIDHKIPIAAHNFTKPEHEDFKRCWALKNLQPMWAKDNISKGAKIEKPFQPSLQM